MKKIDPRTETIFSERFLQKEMARHGIREVRVSEFLHVLRNQPAVYVPSEHKILIDLSYPVDEMLRRLNRENGSGLDMNTDECWGFIFWHECAHATDPSASERKCNEYARERIIEHRKGGEMK